MLMEGVIVQKLDVSRWSFILVGLLCGLLVASGIWNLRQYLCIKEQHQVADAAVRQAPAVAIQDGVKAERAKPTRIATGAKADDRISQLYEEINALTRMSEQVLSRSAGRQSKAVKVDRDEEVMRIQ
jgi:hypothetical protein